MKYYITTAIPYINGLPHIGHSLEYFQADVIRRYHQLKGEETLLLSGADENALKNIQAAEKEGLPIQEFLDRNSKIWKDTYEDLGVHLDTFQRGSDKEKHWPGVQKLWKLCQQNEDIYKKSYEGLYCVGCESFKTESDLINGICPNHQTKPVLVKEENYFFKLSNYQNKLIQIIDSDELKITPENKRQEALSFIRSSLQDFSISRSNERAKGVGVPVPDDSSQKIYVWFDALNIYMTGIGFGWDNENWQKWWPADLHIIGKDINRFHTVYWPAMLLSAGLPLPKQILIHGFVNLKGEKISKSIGNVISPQDIVKKFGLEPLRYYMLSQIPIDGDGDFTIERFKEVYNGDLANGLGNTLSRIAKLVENSGLEIDETNYPKGVYRPDQKDALEAFRFDQALQNIWNTELHSIDQLINREQPWNITDKQKLKTVLQDCVDSLRIIAKKLQPFMPETSEKILKQLSGEIKSVPPLFPRI